MKHHISPANALILLTVALFTWASCHEPEPSYDESKALGHFIPLPEARAYQQRFVKAYDTLKMIANDTFLSRHFNIPNAETFSREAILSLLFPRNCPRVDSVRIYYGEDSTGRFRLLLLPVDKKGNDIYTPLRKHGADTAMGVPSGKKYGGDGDEAVENGQICPPCTISPTY